jgi:hypothetical protein
MSNKIRSQPRPFTAELALPTQVTCGYIDAHKAEHGVEPLCRTLRNAGVAITPSTYYAAQARPPSARTVRDRELTEKIRRVHETIQGSGAST